MRYFRITDECGMQFFLCDTNDNRTAADMELMPYVRHAEEISREEYCKKGGAEYIDDHSGQPRETALP